MKKLNLHKKVLFLLPLLMAGGNTMAATKSDQLLAGVENFDILVLAMLFVLFLLFIAIMGIAFSLYYVVSLQLKKEEVPAEAVEEAETGWWKWFWQKFNAAKPMELETDILMDHEYDGIRELDNQLPPWWKYMFYFTIVFAFCYLGVYHWWTDADDAVSVREYRAEMVAAEQARDAYLAKMASLIDETNVEVASEEAALAEGQDIFTKNCRTCHGKVGEGGAGPNLTDEYWLHGGGIKDIFKTVKYGVPNTAMQSWEKKMTPQQIQRVASFILTLQGSNPENGKAPQGEKWEAEQ
ncbi:cbb3-type cytochrome c oxidase N-terminal domain-containing protein [Limibacter armeniacum]|uniref:cbb3-type cytochrome c oxidase N-terminal domain-containing protein n=1 Tax=Limibacter armeniacum TaxID=466084 RepID=UPI002FE6411A